MDFFAGQDLARRNTSLLLGLFGLAVLLLVLLVNILVIVALAIANPGQAQPGLRFDGELALGVSAAMLAVIGLASVVRMLQLRRGGAAVAEGLGGRAVAADSSDPDERRLLNVVAEMALAAGTPVPRVFVLEGEMGINAFAAGYTPNDAVIGITRGALRQLTRDELQGVIAHEFSHILNGDMRLNLRLIVVLNGILFLAQIGRILLRGMRNSRLGGRKASGTAAIALTGFGLIVLGAGGSFFGSLIKAAVSRQREFLADASAVQFTRNPDGIAGALKRIGGALRESRVDNPRAGESAHLFFADALRRRLRSPLATHPPLDERIRRIDPRWDGQFPAQVAAEYGSEPMASALAPAAVAPPEPAPETAPAVPAPEPTPAVPAPMPAADAAVAAIETPAGAVLDPGLVAAAGRPLAAPALACALLLDPETQRRARQLAVLEQLAPDRAGEAAAFGKRLAGQGRRARLELVELLAPTLQGLDEYTREDLREGLLRLFDAADAPDLVAWAAYRQLRAVLARPQPPRPRFRRLATLRSSLELVLSALVQLDDTQPGSAQQALDAANESLGLTGLRLHHDAQREHVELDRALHRLAQAYPLLKPRILKACIAAIRADERITEQESLMLQIVATAIDCPAPRLVAEQLVAD